MARVHPEGWRELAAAGSAARELQTLGQLAAGLDDGYTVYHGVHWTRIEKGNYTIIGEIDFAIVGPTGKVLLIEQKTGLLSETSKGLVKKYPDHEKNVPTQLARNADALRNRLREAFKGAKTPHVPSLDALLYCPDYAVKSPGTAGIDPSRIVDATRRDQLMKVIREILPAGEPLPSKDRVHKFLGEVLELVPEVHALVGEAGAMYTRLAGGLAHWARQIEFQPHRLRIVGTAGSGKTQLAMAVYRDAIAEGKKPLYVCYNRPLADHVGLIVPTGGEVATYHHLAGRAARALGQQPDFRQSGAFERLEAALDQYTPDELSSSLFDELIIDEGQDFREGWAENLLRFLKPGGRAWWLEDPMQNLYGRKELSLNGWVTLRSDVNYRSPRDILETLNRLLPLPRPMEAGSPLTGSDVEIVSYGDSKDLMAKTVGAVTKCIGLGFKRPHIAVVTYRGREHSRLAPYDKLGPYSLRAPTGGYDLLGNAVFTDGDILIDSVHRFKGRAAPCVIFTEIDFEELDESVVRRIFVGSTRATMKLVLVVSERSAKVLLDRLASATPP